MFGLSGRTPVVLAMAGSNGVFGRLPDVVRAIRRVSHPMQAVVVAGRDTGLMAKLHDLADSTPRGGHPVRGSTG